MAMTRRPRATTAFLAASLFLSTGASASELRDVPDAAVEQPPPASVDSASGAASEVSPPSVETAAQAVVPPQPLGSLAIAYPPDAPPGAGPVSVTVLITIGETGDVTAVELREGAGEPFDSAVLDGAKSFRFSPATLGGKPVAVAVPFTQSFVPPPPTSEAADEKLDALIEGFVVERGTRRPVARAVVAASDAQGERGTTTDDEGRFSIPVAAGESKIRILSNELRPFVRVETLKPGEHLRVKYLADRVRHNPYESVVIGERDRTEISRTTLSGREIHQMPGSMGDPFRVVGALPGVTQVMTLLPLPIVRGSSPGDTGIFLDGMRLPLLFHLLGGPSVIHPEMIERVDFYPGGFPVTYGGYTGGIVDGRTARPRPGENPIAIDVNQDQAGVFARQPIPGTAMTATVAGRYGYPGLMLSLLNLGISLDYWDYQARLDGGSPRSAWSVFFFGARDELKTAQDMTDPSSEMTTQALFAFHRLDLRWRLGDEERHGDYRLVFGYDKTAVAGDQVGTSSYFVDPQVSWLVPLASWLQLNVGGELLVRDIADQPAAPATMGMVTEASQAVQSSGLLINGGVFLQTPLRPFDGLLVIPGVRGDLYQHEATRQWSVDPRMTVRWKPLERELWLKGVVGRYHQPPRLFVPLPGVDQSMHELGLLASTQVGLGVEAQLAPGIELDLQGYYNHKNPVVFDLQINRTLEDMQPSGPWTNPGELPSGDKPGEESDISRFFEKRVGRSYGLEVILRKRDDSGVYGWLAYTLSQSERRDESGWAPFDFDRTHIFNAVLGVRLPRNWEIGGRLMLQSGTPLTTIYGYNASRSDWQFRADLRVDKRAVWNRWLLDFYVDIINSTVAAESGGLAGSNALRYVVPTIGLRAVL